MERLARVGLCVTLVCLPGKAAAQSSPLPSRITLAEAVALAEARNPRVRAEQNRLEMAEADRRDAELRPNPALSIESSGYPLFDPRRPPFFDGQELAVRVDQEIETGGRRGLRLRAADAGIDAARALVEDERRRLRLEVGRAYFEAVLAKANLDVAKVSLDEIDRVIDLNRARFERGEISGAEVRRLQVERLRFADEVFEADLAIRNARSSLLALLNAPDLGQPIDVVDSLAFAPAPTGGPDTAVLVPQGTPDPGALLARARTVRPDLEASRALERRADTETRRQRALRVPNVTVGAGYYRDYGTNAVVAGVTIPLPLFNRNQGGIERADAARRLAANLAAATETTIALEVQQAVNAVDVTRSRVDYIEREYLTNARQSRDIVLASYRLGATDLIDLLDAQRAFRATRLAHNQALFDYRISFMQLATAVGLPLQ